jgi:oligosaccharyltransferase complex subunit alpha (ribophorin I)
LIWFFNSTPTAKITSHSGADEKSTVSGNKVIYGSYHDLPPLSHYTATCHFENIKPFLTANTLERDIEVSHWGNNLAFEEHYALSNDGAG